MHKFRPSSPSVLLLAGLSALTNACLFVHKTPVVFTPPPPSTQPPTTTSAAPPRLPEPPAIAIESSTLAPPDIPLSIPDLGGPPVPKPQPKKQAATPPAPKPATPAAPEPTAPTPRLGQIFTPEQEREYNRTIDDSLGRVKRALTALSRKNLNSDQAVEVNRIAEFQKQAEQAREAHDLVTADLWAKRAATLADDLMSRVP